MVIRIATLITLFMICVSNTLSQEKSAVDYYQLGIESYSIQDVESALEYFNKAVELDPKFVKAYLMRGRILGKRRDYSGAISNFTKAIEFEPKTWAWYGERGLIRLYSGDNDGAIADYLRVIDLNGYKSLAYHFIGHAYGNKAWKSIEAGDIELGKAARKKAIDSFTKAIASDPKDAESYRYRSIEHSRNDDDALALADINKAIDLKPAFVDFYRLRIDIYLKTGKTELAEADEKKISELTRR